MDADAAAPAAKSSGACVQCIERCQREHRAAGHFSSSSLQHPCFLRTVMDHNLRTNMAIPKAFVQVHGRGLPGSTVDLEGANGKVWLVTVVMATTGTAEFRFGWYVFAADNNLKSGDLLLFTMVAKNRFTVRVFSKNGVESTVQLMNNASGLTPKSVGHAAHYNLDSDSDDDFTSSENGEIHGGHGPTIQEIIQNARAYQTTGERRKPRRPLKRHAPVVDVPGSNSTLFASRRRPVTKAERESALADSERLVTSIARPCVPVVMMPSHVYRGFWLNIPNEFSKLHLPDRRARITLKDTWGHSWRAKWIGNDDHNGISGGWAAFSKDHCLEEGDVCVFELLDYKAKYVLRVHICRVVDISFVPGSRGPRGWEVIYNITKPPNPPLPDLNEELPNDEDDDNNNNVAAHPRINNKRKGLADVLQEMIRNGEFSKQQREFVSSKIRALADEDGMHEDEKPDIKPIINSNLQFKRPNAPINLSSDVSVKPEPEDVQSITPANSLPSHTWRPTVKTEPMDVVKTEDVSVEELGSVSPVAVYSRRRRKEGSSASRSMEADHDERVWYPVVRMLEKRKREGKAEKEFRVEILGSVPENEQSLVEHGPDGSWWVPSSHFSTDHSGCYFR